jgi:hypothetical protein
MPYVTQAIVTSGSSITVSKPTGFGIGDVLFAAIFTQTPILGGGDSVPSLAGWTQNPNMFWGGGFGLAAYAHTAVLYRKLDGTEGSMFTFSLSHPVSEAVVIMFGATLTTSPPASIETDPVWSSIGIAGAGGSITNHSISMTNPQALLIWAVAQFNIGNVAPNTPFGTQDPPAGMSKIGSLGGSLIGAVVFVGPQALAGATGTKTSTGGWVYNANGIFSVFFGIDGNGITPPITNPVPPPPSPPVGSNLILMTRLVTGGRLVSPFTRITSLPAQFVSLRQVYNPLAVSQADSFILVGVGVDGNIYRMFGGTQDGTVMSTIVTQPLPTLEDIEPELWDTNKIFREMYVDGVDLPNFRVSYSGDGGATYPNGPYPLTPRMRMGVTAKQLTIKFTHSVASIVTPSITSIKLDYDIHPGKTGN